MRWCKLALEQMSEPADQRRCTGANWQKQEQPPCVSCRSDLGNYVNICTIWAFLRLLAWLVSNAYSLTPAMIWKLQSVSEVDELSWNGMSSANPFTMSSTNPFTSDTSEEELEGPRPGPVSKLFGLSRSCKSNFFVHLTWKNPKEMGNFEFWQIWLVQAGAWGKRGKGAKGVGGEAFAAGGDIVDCIL